MTTPSAVSKTIDRPPGYRVALAGAAVGPVLTGLTIGLYRFDLYNPDGTPNMPMIDEHHAVMNVLLGFAAIGLIALLFGLLGLTWAARRSPRLAVTGGVLTCLAIPSMLLNSQQDLPYMVMHGLDPSEQLDTVGIRLLDAVAIQPGYLLYMLYPIAIFVLAVGLFRYGAGPKWAAVCVATGALLPIGPITGIGALSLAPGVLLALGGTVILLADDGARR